MSETQRPLDGSDEAAVLENCTEQLAHARSLGIELSLILDGSNPALDEKVREWARRYPDVTIRSLRPLNG